jgi:hypothetical protein
MSISMANETSPNDPYEAVLADMKAKISQLQQAVATIEAIRSGQVLQNQDLNSVSPTPPAVQVSPGMFHGMSIVEAVKQLLAMRKKALGTQEITEAITAGGVVFSGDTPANTVGSVLHRESAKPTGGVISVGRGTWALPSWYSNPSRFRKKSGEKAEDEPVSEVTPPKDTGWPKGP